MRTRTVVLASAIAVAACSDSTGPSVPPGTFGKVAGGFQHTCGLLGNGKAYCWGLNSSLALGTGSLNERDSIPRAVAGNRTFAAIDAGEGHSCAITTTGIAYCWGASNDGALGSDTASVTPFPVPVDGGLTFKAITTGRSFTCGLITAGAAYCWGLNDWGQLGRDTTDTRTPVPVAGGHVFTAIAAGDYHTCAIATGGALYCWGSNNVGTLGTGDTATRNRHPVPEAVTGGLVFKSIDAGNSHTCGISIGGAAYCWGANPFGQLGTNDVTDARVPMLVAGGHTYSAVSVGTNHSCALATNGQLYCWGSNGAAQLAGSATALCFIGTTVPCALAPIPSASGHAFRAFTAGGGHTCAVELAGGAFCWGVDANGQVGNGIVKDTIVAVVRVADPVMVAPAY